MVEQSSQLQNKDPGYYPPAVFLMGPTASGKSSVALQIAERLPVEIVSVDSAQVYRYLDIGTAKPDAKTRATLPHHLIDLLEPPERYSAARFVDDALKAMHEITQRGNMPLLVGGTMLYFHALLQGLSQLPSADSGLRGEIETKAEKVGWPAMHNELLQLDPASAARIHSTDSQRIQRALEVCYISGKPMSELFKPSRVPNLPYRIIPIALVPRERALLHQRIAQRFDEMLKLGFIDEVQAIRDKFPLDDASPSMRCVGYRQVWMYLSGQVDSAEMRQMALAATRQLAKRQLTWLRPMKEIKEFDCLSQHTGEQVLRYLEKILSGFAPA
jgi:tRNA dimethylallyltransferase